MADTITITVPVNKLTIFDMYRFNLFCREIGYDKTHPYKSGIGIVNKQAFDSESDELPYTCAKFKDFLEKFFPGCKQNTLLTKIYGKNLYCEQGESLADFGLNEKELQERTEDIENNNDKEDVKTFSIKDYIKRLQAIK